MSERPPNWAEFGPRAQVAPAAPAADIDFDDLCARLLSGPLGAQFIMALRARHIDSPENPLAQEAALRVRITRQQFVRDLEAARDRGLAALKANAKTT